MNRLFAGIVASALLLLVSCAPKNIDALDDPAAMRRALQPELAQDLRFELSSEPRLLAAIKLALERNPGLAAARSNWLAAIHRMPQSTSLPDPMVEAGYQFRDTPMGEEWNLGISQEFPWWQKLWTSGRIADREAEKARLEYESEARDVIVEVKNVYYELFYLDNAIHITALISETLRAQGLAAYAELNSGRAQLGEAFRAESQAAQLEYDLLLLKELRETQAENLRNLLNLPPDTAIGSVQKAPVYRIDADLRSLQDRAETHSQMLKVAGLEVQRAKYETFMAKLSRIPDITAGIGTVSFAPPMDEKSQSLGGRISMNLPIWEQRNRALIDEKKALEEAARQMAMQEMNEIRSAVSSAYFQVRLMERLVHLYESTLIPQAEGVMRQAQALYRSDQASYSNLLETTIAYHNFLLALHRAKADYGRDIGQLEMAIGSTAEPMKAAGQ